MKFNIRYSVDFEVKRILDAISRLEWFRSNNYTVILPESLNLSDAKKITEEDIKDAVLKEYNEQDYLKQKEYLENNLNSLIEECFAEKNLDTDLSLSNQYDIHLTKYGVGGSYNLPNRIIANIRRSFEFGLARTIIHEIIHISIQPLVDKYNVDHWKKERIVDLLFDKFSSRINRMQKVPIDTKSIDESFEKHYPNIEEIIKNV